MRKLWLVVASLCCAGCIRAPEIVMVDRSTALEEQASGSFGDVEHRLDRAGMTPAPVPLTPDQLDALGIRPVSIVDDVEQTAADKLDALLLRHCVGEGKDGLLVDTRPACQGASSPDDLATVDRVNRARLSLWRWMHGVRPDLPEDALRKSWTQNHALGVVCGGWVQHDDGTWEGKKC